MKMINLSKLRQFYQCAKHNNYVVHRSLPGRRLFNTTPIVLREKQTSYFYNQQVIDSAAERPSVHLTTATIMYSSSTSDPDHDALVSAQYLHRELPVRVAHRIVGFRDLPFIVGANPTILGVHEMYIKAFHTLSDFPRIVTLQDVDRYNQLLKSMLEEQKDVVNSLAQGFKESAKYIKDEEIIAKFLNKTLSSKLAVRMLVTHHLHLRDKKAGWIGLINLNMSLHDMVERWVRFATEIAEEKYGHCPRIKISGHIGAHFPYIETPLDYILPELLKNAVRATIEHNPSLTGPSLPPVHVILATSKTDFMIKVSDRGGGIPHHMIDQVLKYNYTTAEDSTEKLLQKNDIFGGMMDAMNQSRGPMHGFGFGLPTSKAYAEYMNGSLKIISMQGLGTDVILRLKHLDTDINALRI